MELDIEKRTINHMQIEFDAISENEHSGSKKTIFLILKTQTPESTPFWMLRRWSTYPPRVCALF